MDKRHINCEISNSCFHGSFHMLVRNWEVALSLVSVIAQPDSKLGLVTAAGRFPLDNDSCEPVVRSFEVLKQKLMYVFYCCAVTEDISYDTKQLCRKINLLPICDYSKFMWSFMASHFLSVSCVCVMKFLFLWTQFTIGGGVRCYLTSPNFILYCQETLKRQQKITHLTCCLRIYLLTSQTDFST